MSSEEVIKTFKSLDMKRTPDIHVRNKELEFVNATVFLGITLNNRLQWGPHITDRHATTLERQENCQNTVLQRQDSTELNRLKRDCTAALTKYSKDKWLNIVNSKLDEKAKIWLVQKSLKKPPQTLPCISGCKTEMPVAAKLTETSVVYYNTVDLEDQATYTTCP
ncbi:hypothetical protein EVAR_42886_1 [Eumeta japonica]|uniref:Uncharacterized protein n=1 Tax=Eumeta variegata TaxID=151549 RepID=A0A4C1YIS3_EUMVA|nr:hypothetical protein EVAR_42886_1 [Eumeta japonica]